MSPERPPAADQRPSSERVRGLTWDAESHEHMEPSKWCEPGLKKKVLDESLSFSKTKRELGQEIS